MADNDDLPLIGQSKGGGDSDMENPLYGSIGVGLMEELSYHDQGGLINEMPTEGYCLVFQAETEQYQVKYHDGKLFIERNPDFSEVDWAENRWEEKLDDITDNRRDDLLKYFKSANIKYKIVKSKDKMEKYWYVIITCKKEVAEDWADKHNIDVPIEPQEAVEMGRQFSEFWLAKRTYLEDKDADSTFPVRDVEKSLGGDDGDVEKRYNKLPLELWDGIHIAYERSIPERVYKKGKAHDKHKGSIITHRLYLRILYEMLTDDRPLGGANFIVEKYLQNGTHPIQAFFALHQSRTERPDVTTEKCFKCRTPSQNLAFCDGIRDYFGENVGFYFHFLVHYTKWLYPMALLGTIWFIIQISVEETTDTGIATPGSTIIVLIAIMWSTMMIENWYRREWKLRFKWGMMRYKQTEIPRPTFSGKIVVSRENGEIIETYKNWWSYCCKITCSMSTMLLCVAIVVATVAGLFVLKGGVKDDDPNYQYMTIGIGMANSIQIFIMNKLYTWLAYKLNEWEGHRLQQEYYNNLVIKRIIFIVFNSFYSLFYIAFIDPRYDVEDNTKEENDKIRLEAVRTQLVTLFLMAIILQNSLEILFPWLGSKIKVMCMKREEEEWAENANSGDRATSYQSDALLSDDDQQAKVHNVVDVGDDNLNVSINNDAPDDMIRQKSTIIVNKDVLDDIEEQINMGPSPDVLDNTAEIVILHGYIMLFVIVFPLMPLLAAINNYVELRVDFYNLINSQRPIPATAAGLGVWKSVLACFNIIAVFSNLGILVFRTELIKGLLQSVDAPDGDIALVVFYFSFALLLLFIIFVIRIVIDDQTVSTREAISRQEACERHLLMAPVKASARHAAKEAKRKASQRKLKGVDEENNDEDDQKREL